MNKPRSSAIGCLLVGYWGLLAFHWIILFPFGLGGTYFGTISPGEDDVAFRTDPSVFFIYSFPLFASVLVLLPLAALLPLRWKPLWLALCIPPSVIVVLVRWYYVTHYPMWD
ncbi:MAG: hypothetical protein H6907_09040 [Hyphomicrobiales bacterium]|nr:hypothetical protein [Hyphomicrobiales bacterium]MCP5371863.1 hypothetical protein [Hyphomicrobiales bacterium]